MWSWLRSREDRAAAAFLESAEQEAVARATRKRRCGELATSAGEEPVVAPERAASGNGKSIRVPAAVVAEMFQHLGKNAKLGTEFIRKYETIQFTLGIPWLSEVTRRWLLVVLVLQAVHWTMAITSVVATTFAGKLPRFVPAFVAPLLTLHHFIGYLCFARRSALLSCVFTLGGVMTAALEGTELASAMRDSLDTAGTALEVANSVSIFSCSLGLLSSIALFWASLTLFLRLRFEEHETRVLIPVETLEETPNEFPFIRWYFGLPLAPSNTYEAACQ